MWSFPLGHVVEAVKDELKPEQVEPDHAAIERERRRQLNLSTELPDCYVRGKKMFFAYKGAKGEDVVVDDIVSVPRDKRKDARCLQPQ